jgi:hypothetical protein
MPKSPSLRIKQFRRKSTEPKEATEVLFLRIDPGLNAALRRHAWERQVSKERLCEDLLRSWVLAVTDPDDTTFSPQKMGVPMPKPIPADRRPPGYLDSLMIDTDDPQSHLNAK